MDDFLKEKFNDKKPFFRRRVLLIIGAILILAGIMSSVLVLQAASYDNRVTPGIYIGEISVGGMMAEELEDFLQSMNNKLLSEGFGFYFQNGDKMEKFFFNSVIVTEGNAIELMSIDTDKEVKDIINYGKEGNIFVRAFLIANGRIIKQPIKLKNIIVDKERIRNELSERLTGYGKKPSAAAIKIKSIEPLEYEIVSSTQGVLFQYEEAINKLVFSWSILQSPDVEINKIEVDPSLRYEQVESIVSQLPAVFDKGGLMINYENPNTKRAYEWPVNVNKIAEWLNVQEIGANKYTFGLDKEMVGAYLDSTVAPRIEVGARDAKFSIDESGAVREFQGSRPGVEVEMEETYNLLNQAILRRVEDGESIADSIGLIVKIIEPNTTTGEANNMGIKEVLGVGISNFSGSPVNRIKNIKNAVKKLNGVLIKPGEEFSAIKYTKPYTVEGGYLPELVIKGDEIKPEVGGGLCQIGTTLFRMAMNSGMPILERRNHSLVVSYYNDRENGLPGTDATVYEPNPDFRFLNDTGNYILIQTDIEQETNQLIFTLWGTSDGRKGWYEPPIVEKWIPHGETKNIETTNLAPGVKQCQHAYKGAVAEFKYIRELTNGEKIERIFESYYRPLPEICLIGVEKKAESCFDENGKELSDCAGDLTNDEGNPIIAE